jgi:LacI family transcriptional regulator
MDQYWHHPYHGTQKAELALKHYGAHVECHFFDLFDPADFLKKAQKVLDTKPDGILFPPLFHKEGIILLDECKLKEVPTIIINTFIEHPHVLAYIGQDSFQSGVLAARLLNFALRDGEPALILNLEKGVTNALHILEKERGFRYYFANNVHKKINVVSRTFEDFENKKMLRAFLSSFTRGQSQVGGIFVTNSRAYKLVESLEQDVLDKLVIVGFDPIEPNNQYLYGNKINFLINQNSVEQGYLGILALFKAIFLKQMPEPIQFLPLDIVVAENIQYYLERQETMSAFH